MSPEQINDPSRVGPPADIWAFGVVAYECLTGARRPSRATRSRRFSTASSLASAPREPRRAAAAAGVRRVVRHGLRPQSAQALLERERRLEAAHRGPRYAEARHVGELPGARPVRARGERRVVVVPGEESTEPTAPTLESKPLLSRTHDDEFESLQRIPLRSVAPPETDADARAAAGARRRPRRGGTLAASGSPPRSSRAQSGRAWSPGARWLPEPSAPAAAANAATAVTAAATVPAVPAVVALPEDDRRRAAIPRDDDGGGSRWSRRLVASTVPRARRRGRRPRSPHPRRGKRQRRCRRLLPQRPSPPAATTNDERHATPPPSATTTGAVNPGSYR